MEFKIQKEILINNLYHIQGVAERKSTMPILANVLIETKGKDISFTATDLEVGIVSHCQAEVIKQGKVAVSARNLYEIAKELSDELISIKVLPNYWVEILCGKSKFKIVGSSAENFPSLPSTEGDVINLEAKDFLEMINRVSYAMSNDETRYTLNGVFLEQLEIGGKKQLRIVATDGHRLSIVDRVLKDGIKVSNSVILPKKGVWELKKLLDGVDDKFSLKIGEKTLSAATKSVTLICRLIDGQFPPYKQVIPKDNNRVVSVDKGILSRALKRVSIIASEKARGVKLVISPGNLDIFSSNPDIGEAKEELQCVYKGETFEMGFNIRYFLDIIGVLDDEKIVLELKNDTSPCIIRSEFDKGFLSVIMPMRL